MLSCMRATLKLLLYPVLFLALCAGFVLYIVFGIVLNDTVVRGYRPTTCYVLVANLACPAARGGKIPFNCWNLVVTSLSLWETRNGTVDLTSWNPSLLPVSYDQCRTFTGCGNHTIPCLYNPKNLADLKLKPALPKNLVVILSLMAGVCLAFSVISLLSGAHALILQRREKYDEEAAAPRLGRGRGVAVAVGSSPWPDRGMDRAERGLRENESISDGSSADSLSWIDRALMPTPPPEPTIPNSDG